MRRRNRADVATQNGMTVDLIVESGGWDAQDLARLAEGAARATLIHMGFDPDGFGIALLACDDNRIAELNRAFRDKRAATNVLSWPSEERGALQPGGAPIAPDDPELGDIAVAYETCAREAAAQGKAFETHIVHLLVHGTLHLLGYDHIDDQDAALMETLEVAILDRLGVADPYSE